MMRPAKQGLSTAQAMVDAQRVAIRHPNPRVALALANRVEQVLQEKISSADQAEALVLRDTIVELAGLVSTELDRLRMELVHHMGTAEQPKTGHGRLDRIAG